MTLATFSDQLQLDADELGRLIKLLQPEELEEFDRLLKASAGIWAPLPGPQTMAFESKANVIGFGGAAGGGKTDLAVGLALTEHRRSAIFRREATQLMGINDRIAEMVGSRDFMSGKDKVWRIPGSAVGVDHPVQIEWGSTPNPGDEKRYQGRPKDLLVLDEATEFLESQVRFLLGWVRTTVANQRTRALMTFNPPTNADGRWILDYFAPWLDDKHPIPAEPGELVWFVMMDGKEHEWPDGQPFMWRDELVIPQSRTFIPSRIADNPYLVSTGYVSQLQAMPEPLRSQMLYGDFKAGMEDDAYQIIPTRWVDEAMKKWVERRPKPEMSSLGVDVSRGGQDNTVIARRHGMWFDKPIKLSRADTDNGHKVAAHVITATKNRAPAHIDVIGVGASPYDILLEARQHAVGVNASQEAPSKDKTGTLKFLNYRAWMWWKMREALDPDNDTGIELPPDNELRADLTAPRWSLSGRSIKMESRDDLIKRIGRSPDMGTAYVQALIDTPKIAEVLAIQELSTHVDQQLGHNPYEHFHR